MRKLLLLSILFFSSKIFAQTNFRFADSTAQWHQCNTIFSEGTEGIGGSVYLQTFRVEGDSLFNNSTYQRIREDNTSTSTFIKEDSTGKVFRYDFTLQRDKMIYDFGLSQYDTFKLTTSYAVTPTVNDTAVLFVVDSIDYVVFGTSKKRMFLRCVSGHYCSWYHFDTIIEGVGSLHSNFLNPYFDEFIYIPGQGFKLLSYDENGITYNFLSSCSVVIDVKDVQIRRFTLSPNPATNLITIQSETNLPPQTTFQLFDITGRMVLQRQLTAEKTTVLLNEISKGMYLYNITSLEKKIGSGKLVVQ